MSHIRRGPSERMSEPIHGSSLSLEVPERSLSMGVVRGYAGVSA